MTDVVQVSFHLDRENRPPAALLEAWPVLERCAVAAAEAGVNLAVVQAAAGTAIVERGGVAFHFVHCRPGLRRGTPGTQPVAEGDPVITRAVRELEPRLLHVHGLSLPGHARALKQAVPGARLMVQDHADGLPRPWRRRAACRDMASFDAVAFTAADQAMPFFNAGLFAPGLMVHEVLEASVAHDEPCARSDSDASSVSFVWLGRLDRNKDPLTVLAGFSAAAHHFPGARLRMCFLGAALLPGVRERITNDPVLADRVDLLGACSQSEVWRILCESDFLLQGSRREGSGYAVIEALACGVTPIVTDIPSLRTIVGDAGFLWSPRDERALVTSLERAATIDRRAFAARARARFEKHLSWGAIGAQLARAYESTMSAAGQALPPTDVTR